MGFGLTRDQIWNGLVSLKPLSGLFVWIFKLVAIISMLVLAFCSVVISIATVMPEVINPQSPLVTNCQLGLVSATDFALLGVVAMCRESWEKQEKKFAIVLGIVGSIMFLLMLTTYAFFIFKIKGTPDQILTLARCGAALMYAMVAHPHERKKDDHGNGGHGGGQGVQGPQSPQGGQGVQPVQSVPSGQGVQGVQPSVNTSVITPMITPPVVTSEQYGQWGDHPSVDSYGFGGFTFQEVPLVTPAPARPVATEKPAPAPAPTRQPSAPQPTRKPARKRVDTPAAITDIRQARKAEKATVASPEETRARIREALLILPSSASDRAVARQAGCSPASVTKHRAMIVAEIAQGVTTGEYEAVINR